MKKIYIGFILLCILTVSCKKSSQNATSTSGEKHSVAFSVNNFSQQHTGFLTTNDLITDASSPYHEVFLDTATGYRVLYFISLPDSTSTAGTISATEYQGQSGFGTFSTLLVNGTYSYLIVGGVNDKQDTTLGNRFLHPFELGNGDGSGGYITYSGALSHNNFGDLFVKEITFTVNNNSITQTVNLNRVVAKLDVVIQDAIPSNITYIQITTSPFNMHYYFNATTTYGPDPGVNFVIPKSAIGTTNYDMAQLLLDTAQPLTVTITAYSGTTVVANKVVSGVSCTPNNITMLEGNLFGGTGNSGGAITIKGDTSWNANTINYHF